MMTEIKTVVAVRGGGNRLEEGTKGTSWFDRNVLNLDWGGVTQVLTFIRTYQIVNLKSVQFTLCKFFLNRNNGSKN